MYNCLTRDIERELVPVCRRFGLSLMVYNATAGGFISANRNSARFTTAMMSERYKARYLVEPFETAVALVLEACQKHNLSPYDVALRWLAHHSKLRRGIDGIIIGCSTVASLQKNVASARAGPLPDEILTVLDSASKISKPAWPTYWR